MEGLFSALLPIVALSLLLLVGNSLDIILLIIFKAYKDREFIHQFIQERIDLNNVIYISKYVAVLFIAFQAWRFLTGLTIAGTFSDEFPVKPMLFPCQTSHVRMFPKKHGFSYSYLLVGIPVGWKGHSGGMISSEEEDTRSWYQRWFSLKPGLGWWSVNSDHYLARGHNKDGLAGKLREYLERQNIDPKQYAHAYLLTAARFLNYASNPVSIWHLYSSSKVLTGLVLEVNNTSDERRIYFLSPTSTILTSKPQSQNPDLPPSIRYTGAWPKDFYVSTFNDRTGKYSLAAYDPLSLTMKNAGQVNCTITLSSPDNRAMLIARVYSAGKALDPSSMSVLSKTRFLMKWWWVGYMTFFPRTVWEAFKLFARRGVKWVSRPEPRRETMSRVADGLEIAIERKFRGFLEDRVRSSKGGLEVRYIPAGLVGDDAKEICFGTAGDISSTTEDKRTELRVLTPLFYSRIVQYPNIHAGLRQEVQSNTIEISNPALLQYLDLDPIPTQNNKSSFSLTTIYLYLIKHLRCSNVSVIPSLEQPSPSLLSPQLPSYTTSHESHLQTHKTNSGLDIFPFSTSSSPAQTTSPTTTSSSAANTGTKQINNQFLTSTLKILFSERLALGWIEILDLEVFLFKIFVLWLLV